MDYQSAPIAMPDESWTALGNAAARATETQRADRLFSDHLAQHFVAAAGSAIPLHPTQETPPQSKGTHGSEMMAMIGDVIVIKTRFFDEYFHRVCAAACRQVVVLAAGLDTRAFRLNWPAGVRLFEVDLPDVLEFKEQVLLNQAARPACERIVVHADLRDDWPTALRNAGLDTGHPTAWLAEGTLGFLTAADCDRLLDEVNLLSGPSSWFALDHTHDGSVATPRLQPFLEETGISLDEMIRGGPTDPADRWLVRHGWLPTTYDVVKQAAAYQRPTPALFRGDRQEHGNILFQAQRTA
ncbi:MAG: SAM-dependent methyltransferase [Pseudonocardiales bacterium]|nr:SAM-dependent methyltransferase [Pseudonocardiales bacterium]